MIGTSASPQGVQVWVATRPVDMRKSFDGLAEVVRRFLGHDPLSGSLFVFRNRSAERVKILWWDRDGLVIYSSAARFASPPPTSRPWPSTAANCCDCSPVSRSSADARPDGGPDGGRFLDFSAAIRLAPSADLWYTHAHALRR